MAEVSRTLTRVEGKRNQLQKFGRDNADKRNPRLKKMNGHSNSGSSSSAGCEVNYCEVYYLSPSKRRARTLTKDFSTTGSLHDTSPLGSQRRREKFKQPQSQHPDNVFALTSYPNQNNRQISLPTGCVDPNLDNFEVWSHYSDSAATTASNHLNRARCNNVTFSNCTEERVHSNRGSLKKGKVRSSQSLCSCDADTDIIPNPDPIRPLYRYSLDSSKSKSHTYTCEQNAQILKRLEKERLKSSGSLEKQINDSRETNGSREDSSFEFSAAYQDTTGNLESDSLTEVESIPPPPPPAMANRKQQMPSAYQHQQQQGFVKDFANSSVGGKPSESMLNDCTSTILNCANMGQVVTTAKPPDLCNVNRLVKSVKSDPTWLKANQENISIAGNQFHYTKDDAYLPCFKSKDDESVFFYQQQQQQLHQQEPLAQQYAPTSDNRFHSTKFNTIGPSSYCAKQFANYHPNSSCNFELLGSNNHLSNGRYFSQSLSNFSFAAPHTRANYLQHQHNHEFSTTPYTQFQASNTGLTCSLGESALIGGSYTSTGSSSSILKSKLHAQQQLTQANSSMPWRHRQCPSRGSSSSGTSSLRFDPSRHWLAVSSILLIVGAASVAVPLALRVAANAPFEERLEAATQLLDAVPLIDGHNDLPWNIRKFLHNKLTDFNFDEDLRNVMPWARSHWSHTDLQRLKKGRVSAQFWAAYVPCEAQHRDAVQLTLEQIDVIKRLTERYSPQLTTCTSASDIIEAHKNHQLCSLTGVEGGHSLGGSLAVLRTLYAIGVRYMTLTSTCHTPWADSSHADAPKYDVKHGGLTVFGKTIIREMNRLGMIVDLSHVSVGTMRDALATTEAPVIFSHSSAYELCNSSRNVQDDILHLVAKNGGLVMVNFYSKFLSCSENSTVHDAVSHINHIKRIAGIDHVGLGAGFDGINFTPKGLEDVSTYPTLFAELLGQGWSVEDLTKLAGQNFLRVLSEVEKVRDTKKLAGIRPYEDHPNFRTEDPYNCTSS